MYSEAPTRQPTASGSAIETDVPRFFSTPFEAGEARLWQAAIGPDVQPLRPAMRDLLSALAEVGETRCVTRNPWAIHELYGTFTHPHFGAHTGLILNPRGLDLRLMFDHWYCAFAIQETGAQGRQHSIQFFDRQGDALLKVYATARTDMAAWAGCVTRFLHDDPPPLDLLPPPAPLRHDAADPAALDKSWREMQDVHQFFALLRKNGLSRTAAFRAVGRDLAYPVGCDALTRLLTLAQEEGNEIMVFVGSRGCVQIFTGAITTLNQHRDVLWATGNRFTLHVQQSAIAESWITRKPTRAGDGFVTSLELFAADGTQIAQLYGERTEDKPEQESWRRQLRTLEPLT